MQLPGYIWAHGWLLYVSTPEAETLPVIQSNTVTKLMRCVICHLCVVEMLARQALSCCDGRVLGQGRAFRVTVVAVRNTVSNLLVEHTDNQIFQSLYAVMLLSVFTSSVA